MRFHTFTLSLSLVSAGPGEVTSAGAGNGTGEIVGVEEDASVEEGEGGTGEGGHGHGCAYMGGECRHGLNTGTNQDANCAAMQVEDEERKKNILLPLIQSHIPPYSAFRSLTLLPATRVVKVLF